MLLWNDRIYRFCIHDKKDGVGNITDNREIFERIFQKRKIDFYLCDKARYYVLIPQGNMLLDSLKEIQKDKKGHYIKVGVHDKAYLSSQNFSIMCECNQCFHPDAWVKEYTPHEKKKENQTEFKLVIQE